MAVIGIDSHEDILAGCVIDEAGRSRIATSTTHRPGTAG